MPRVSRAAGKSMATAPTLPRSSDRPSGNDEDVAQVAYELFMQRGGVHGHDQDDWFEAEQLVRERQRRAR